MNVDGKPPLTAVEKIVNSTNDGTKIFFRQQAGTMTNTSIAWGSDDLGGFIHKVGLSTNFFTYIRNIQGELK